MIVKKLVDDDLNAMVKRIIDNADMKKMNVAKECKRVDLPRTTFYRYLALENYGDLKLDELNRFLNIFGYRLDMIINKLDD